MEKYKELADRLKKRYKGNETGSTFVTLCSLRDVLNAATAITELLARAEKAEVERDAAIKELDGVSNAVGDLADFIDEEIYSLVPYDIYTALMDNVYAITAFEKESEWRGQKEE